MSTILDVGTPPAPAMSWARARLRLGQTNVGLWVVTALALIVAQPALPGETWAQDATSWAVLVGLFVALQAPLDVVGGYVLPVQYGRRKAGFGAWAVEWARGVAVHAAVWLALGWGLFAAAAVVGPLAAAGLAPVFALGLLAAQGALLRATARIDVAPVSAELAQAARAVGIDPDRVSLVETPGERGFVGGWLGFPGQERLLLPAAWANDPALRPVVLARRAHALQSGGRAAGALAAWAFNAVGWAAALLLVPGAGVDSAAGLLLTTAGVTLWAFLGLLTLPTLSRQAVHALDRHAARALGRDTVVRAIDALDRDQEDERERPTWQGRIFHPVPTPTARAKALDEAGDGRVGPWRITRMALYLGWAHGSWLSRAVHCNCGRPALWVVPPGD